MTLKQTSIQTLPQTTTYPTLRKFIAGGVSCAVISALLNPMDLIKVRLQTQNELKKLVRSEQTFKGLTHGAVTIAKNEGLHALWTRGLTASMIREISYSSIRMGLYDPVKQKLCPTGEASLSKKILAGLISGGLGSCFVNPSDLVKIRIQGEVPVPGKPPRYKNTFYAFFHIAKHEGIRGLYKGVGATTTRAAILTAAQLASYDHTKHALLRTRYFGDTVYTHITCSLVSGLVTTIATSPVDVIKTRYMNDAMSHDGKKFKYKNSIDCLIKTLRNEGIHALYKGFVPNYLRLGPHFVLSLPLYEQLRKLLGVGTM